MPWYTYILFGVYVISCFILIGVVLLQSGKGDIASAFGGGGSQTAFGPRSASSTLSRVTMGAAIAFMALSFIFTLPGVLRGGSVAHSIEDAPAATQPAPAPPAPLQQPAPQQPANQSQPAATPGTATPGNEQKPAEAPAQKPAEAPAKPEQKK
jgi:preprotein translocase subunit SecG